MRTLIALSVAVIGAGVGLLGDLVFWQGTPDTFVLTVAGLLVGLVAGLVVARLAYPRPRREIDPARYPNRVIQRRP